MLRYSDGQASPDSLGRWGADEQSYTTLPSGGWLSTPLGFGRHLAAFGRSGRAVLGSTDSLNATVLDSTGVVLLRLIGRFEGAWVSSSDLKAWKADWTGQISSDLPEPLKQALLLAPHDDTYPAFDRLLIDSDGDVWVGSAVEWGELKRAWIVFDLGGRPIGAVELPKSVDLLDVAYGRAVGRVRDDQGVEDVIVYRVRRHG